MEIETAWVNPPLAIGGLDHLLAQAPCINIYGQSVHSPAYLFVSQTLQISRKDAPWIPTNR